MAAVSIPNDLALFSSQKEMEELFSKHQVMHFLKTICVERGYDKNLIEADIPVPFGLDLLAQMMLHKRANVVTLVGLLRSHFSSSEAPDQACADMLVKAVEVDAVDYDEDTNVFIVAHDITDEEQNALDKFQYPLPMIEHPEPVTSNHETGYQSIPGSLILKKNHHDEDICLDHINRVNDVALSLNPDVIAFMQLKWKHVDKIKDGESYQDFKQRQKAFQKYNRTSREVLTSLMAAGNHFWLTHKYDKRGRTYCQGYHVQYQGSDWNKACIEFANGEPLNEA